MSKHTIKQKTSHKNRKGEKSKSNKNYPSTASLRATPQPHLTLEVLNRLIQNELPTIKNIDIDAITTKIEEIKETNLGKTQRKHKQTVNYVKNLVGALINTFSAQSVNLRSKKIHEFKPLNGNYKDDVCITSKYNLKKLESSGRGAFGKVYKFRSGAKTLAVKVVDISRANENSFMKCWGGWSQYYTVEQMEKEAAISRHLGELGIGPKIHDVFYCISNDTAADVSKQKAKQKKTGTIKKTIKNTNSNQGNSGLNTAANNTEKENPGHIKYYYVMDYMNRGSLQDYMDANDMKVLPEKYIQQIIAKLDKMHEAGYIHDDLHTGNILVNEPRKGQLEFYISDFGLSNKMTAKLAGETQDLYDTLKYDGNRKKKTDELLIEYFTKIILNKYLAPVLGK